MNFLDSSKPVKLLITIILVLAGVALFAQYAEFYSTGAQCRAWGWASGDNGICYGELNSGDKISKPLKEIKAQSCVGPFQITQPTKRDKHPNNCPSGIHFSGKRPFFQNLKINEHGATY